MCETALHLALSLAPGPGPVAGVLETGSERFEFTGWIELTALIEARREAEHSPARGPAPPESRS
jgi:hypothetical protein